jgi:hypothetical protein
MADPAQELAVAVRVVGDAEAVAVRPAAGVEMVFRNVDADGSLAHLSGSHACHASLVLGFPFGTWKNAD